MSGGTLSNDRAIFCTSPRPFSYACRSRLPYTSRPAAYPVARLRKKTLTATLTWPAGDAVCSHNGGMNRISPGFKTASQGEVPGGQVTDPSRFLKTSTVELDAPGGICRCCTSVGGKSTSLLSPRTWHRTFAITYSRISTFCFIAVVTMTTYIVVKP